MLFLYIILAVVLLFIVVSVSLYNNLVKKRNLMQEGWSSIDVFLKKRHDLIPNLVNIVKGYTAHEKTLLEEVTSLRTQAIQSVNIDQKVGAETDLSHALGKLFVSVENYPDLKASQNFRDLQGQLATVENELEMSRRYYNGTVRENNIAIETFPGNIVAGMFHFEKGLFFNIDNEQEKQNPIVSF
ncbi:LemA family protein [Mucilaginibacter sp.]|uniref:LemA family protein n=1 Tax=Mucilaginibacter sp. TaxID=1882438 RepID=UPI0035BC2598